MKGLRMKKVAYFILSLCAFSVAHADQPKEKAIVCLTGAFKADGTIAYIGDSGGPEVVILDNGTATTYRLIDQFSLYHPMYNRNTPFNLALVSPYGASTGYTIANNYVSTDWQIIAQPVTTATLKVDMTQGNGNIETDTTDGTNSTETSGDLVCTQVGTVGTPPKK